jgi:hypothetical protein
MFSPGHSEVQSVSEYQLLYPSGLLRYGLCSFTLHHFLTLFRAQRDMSERLPPFFRLTENDQGGVAAVVALCTIVITSSISAIRWLVASRQHVEFQRDDATFYLGSVRTLLT